MTLGMSCDTCDGWLTIDGISLNTPAWRVVGTDLPQLWQGGDVRGSDRLVPGAIGVLPYRRRFTVTRHSLTMIIVGEVDHLGNPATDPREGFYVNLAYLRTNVTDPTNVTDGTRHAVLTLPDQVSTIEGDIHILGLTIGAVADGTNVRTGVPTYGALATLDISIPGGVLS